MLLVGCTGPSAPTPEPSGPGTPVSLTNAASPTPSDDATGTPTARQEQLAPGPTTCVAGTRYGINQGGDYRLTGPCEVLSIGADRADVDITGALGSLSVNGQNNEVDAGDIASISVSGDDNDIEAGAVTSVQMQGQSNDLSATGIETVTIAGDRNEVDGGARIGVVTVNGNDNEFEARNPHPQRQRQQKPVRNSIAERKRDCPLPRQPTSPPRLTVLVIVRTTWGHGMRSCSSRRSFCRRALSVADSSGVR